MARRDVQIGLWILVAAAAGFLIAVLVFGGNDNKDNTAAVVTDGTTTTTTTSSSGTTGPITTTATGTTPATTPQSPSASLDDCITLWNGKGNRSAQIYLINIASQQPVRVHVGQTGDVPPQCLVTVVTNSGDAYIFPEGGGSTFPYAPAPSRESGSTLPAEQKTSNALEQRDGTLAAH